MISQHPKTKHIDEPPWFTGEETKVFSLETVGRQLSSLESGCLAVVKDVILVTEERA